jgi:RNA polymerase sigma factor (sigma-70 family)
MLSFDAYRRELQVHCYRMLGSVADAEDALQETLLSAWQELAGFEGRASIRTWLYRVATSRCLDALRSARRRPPASKPPAGLDPPEPTRGWTARLIATAANRQPAFGFYVRARRPASGRRSGCWSSACPAAGSAP